MSDLADLPVTYISPGDIDLSDDQAGELQEALDRCATDHRVVVIRTTKDDDAE